MNDGLCGYTNTVGTSPTVFSVMEKLVSDARNIGSASEKNVQVLRNIVGDMQNIASSEENILSTVGNIVSGIPTIPSALEKILSMVKKILSVPENILSPSENIVGDTQNIVEIDRCPMYRFSNNLVAV